MNLRFPISMIMVLTTSFLLYNCESGVEAQLQKTWILRDIEGDMATEEWKALMKIDTISLSFMGGDVLEATWYNPDTLWTTTHGTGTWFVVPEEGEIGKLVLDWDQDDLDRVIIGELTNNKLVLPIAYAEDTVLFVFKPE